MVLDSSHVKGLFGVVAGIVTIFRFEAWIGPNWPNAIRVRGPAAVVIGCVAIGLGGWLAFGS